MSMSSEGQGHTVICSWKGFDLSNDVCEYEVNRLINEKVIRGKQNFNATVYHAGRPSDRPPGRIHRSISRFFLWEIRLKPLY